MNLDTLLATPPLATETVAWGKSELTMAIYPTSTLPPDELITSARALVLRPGQILVIRDPGGLHIVPGGRREPGESPEMTLKREIGEETGWNVSITSLLGLRLLRHRTPRPPGYRYPYPYFAQVVYLATALDYDPRRREINGYELEATWVDIAHAHTLPLSPTNQAWLTHLANKTRPD